MKTPRPEPRWHAKARDLRKDGFGATEIGRIVSKTPSAVRYVIIPGERERTRERVLKSRAKRK